MNDFSLMMTNCRLISKKKKNLSITDQILIRKTKYDNVVDDDDVFAKTKKTTDIII